MKTILHEAPKNGICAHMIAKNMCVLALTIDVPAKADIKFASLNCCIGDNQGEFL